MTSHVTLKVFSAGHSNVAKGTVHEGSISSSPWTCIAAVSGDLCLQFSLTKSAPLVYPRRYQTLQVCSPLRVTALSSVVWEMNHLTTLE